jgi:Ca2+:H+ antiporter
MLAWPVTVPAVALGLLGASTLLGTSAALTAAAALALFGAVLAAVHHAEVVAHRVGEPFGTLVLALAVTVIEVALIVSVMISSGPAAAALPRDTLYAAIMIICNGVVGACVLIGGLHHREQSFQIAGTGPALAALVVLGTIVLAMPVFTTSSPQGTYTTAQLGFVGVASLALWSVFVFVQTVRHRDYFLPPADASNPDAHAAPPGARQAMASGALLMVSLVGVVGLAELLSPRIEAGIQAAGLPKAVVGIVIAMLVLLPETWAALRAARADRLQTSMNLALGSALACVGLTVPAVVLAAVWLDLPLVLGLEPKDMAMLAMTFVASAITLGSGRTHLMQGAVHLVVFAAFLFLAFVP